MKKILLILFTICQLCLVNTWAKQQLKINDPILERLQVFEFTGSALCEDLTLTYHLPDSLKSGYIIDLNFKRIDLQLTVTYTATKTDKEILTQKIETNISDYFLPIEMSNSSLFDCDFFLEVDEEIEYLGVKRVSPFTKCYHISPHCEEITIIRKEFIVETNCGSYPDYNLIYEISNDSVIIKEDPQIIPTVCIPYNTHIRTDTLKITDFEAVNYTIYLAKIVNVFIIIGGDKTTIYEHLPIGNAHLNDCIIDGIVKNQDVLEIFPNPANEYIYLVGYSGEIKLINQFGQESTINGNEVFNTSQLNKGVYTIMYELNEKFFSGKLIIE